jgi:hypothetical protein
MQWVLKNSGQSLYPASITPGVDLNVLPVHASGFTGRGVKVMVLDGGLDTRHEDLAANVDRAMLHNFDPRSTDPHDPGLGDELGVTHGTAMAGIVGAVAHNDVGGRGVAPGVRLGAARLIYSETTPPSLRDLTEAYGGAPFSRDTDIFSSSYGWFEPSAPSLKEFNAHIEVAAFARLPALRHGKGAVVVKPAGNEFESDGEPRCTRANKAGLTCINAAFNNPAHLLPQTIVVASVNAQGYRSSFSNSGANILVAGLGGDNAPVGPGAFPLGLITTDMSGCERGESAHFPRPEFEERLTDFEIPGRSLFGRLNPRCNYVSTASGTSAAVPTVAGVIALMLEANPELTWRDIRAILARTSRRIDADRPPTTVRLSSGQSYEAEPAWTRNAAGLWFHNWYGFGLVDAAAAVNAATQWRTHLSGPMRQTSWLGEARLERGKLGDRSAKPVEIPAGHPDGGGYAIQVEHTGLVEFVQVRVVFDGLDLADAAIELRSPSGTRSVLLTPRGGLEHSSPIELVLASNAFFSEPMDGAWTLRVVNASVQAPEIEEDAELLPGGEPPSEPQLLGWALKVMGQMEGREGRDFATDADRDGR